MKFKFPIIKFYCNTATYLCAFYDCFPDTRQSWVAVTETILSGPLQKMCADSLDRPRANLPGETNELFGNSWIILCRLLSYELPDLATTSLGLPTLWITVNILDYRWIMQNYFFSTILMLLFKALLPITFQGPRKMFHCPITA